METVVKIDLQKILSSPKPIIIELGCGKKKKTDRITIDRVDLPNVDIVANIEDGLPFLPDNCVDEIHCRSVLEHIQNFEDLMGEIVRILKKEGKAYIFVPHFSNSYYYSDYTHKKSFGLYTFYYFVASENQLRRKVPVFYNKIRIKIIHQKLTFRSSFKILRPFKKLFGWFVNLHPLLQAYYEENLCYLLPCDGINIVFTPDKNETVTISEIKNEPFNNK